MNIYLSKSNQANPDDLIFARNRYSKQGNLLEFKGGQYDPNMVTQADKIVVLPPAESEMKKSDDGLADTILIGRGNYSELQKHQVHMTSCEQEPQMFLFKDQREYKILKATEVGINWQNSFARLYVVPTQIEE